MPGKAYAPLAMCLGKQGRVVEAVRLCTSAAKSDDSARPALALALVLSASHPSPEDMEQAEPFLVKAVEVHADNADLLFALANIRIVQQRTDDAVKLYEQVLANKPDHVFTLNNLATLLSEQPQRRNEALGYVDRAIELAGRQPALLDTKGMILVHEDDLDLAVECLKIAASATSHPDPRYHFHLAVAYLRLGADEKARSAMKKASAGNLEGELLTPTDRKLLAELRDTLNL